MKFITWLVCSVLLVSCAQSENSDLNSKAGLQGTWRLVSYMDLDTVTGKWKYPYGQHPRGFFTYTPGGIVNLNISAEVPLKVPSDSIYIRTFTLGAMLDQAVGYFGTYTIDTVHSVVTHHVKGGSALDYIGTDQQRQFELRGDTLWIGDPQFRLGKRVLVREH